MRTNTRSRRRFVRIGTRSLRRRAVLAAASALGTALVAGSAAAAAPAAPPDASGNFTYQTVKNPADATFSQLLGINNSDTIAGYFGSGMPRHPNKGYTLHVNFHDENYPGSAQTQVTGLNNSNVTVGFWVDGAGDNRGFYAVGDRRFHTADYPTSDPAKPSIDQLLGVNDQLLGVNDHNLAVGFYTDGKGVNHGYSYDIEAREYKRIDVSGDTNVTAAAINDLGDIAGFGTHANGATEGFLKLPSGRVVHLSVPGASATQALGVNNGDEVVGFYTVGTGTDAASNGFVWAPGFGFESVSDPQGVGSTTINGVNDRGTLAGFYTDSGGNTDGMVARTRG
jgi:hypothetical protein